MRDAELKDMDETGVVESYYLETLEGLYFAVKGLEHPPDRWLAVLRYAPDSGSGNRIKNGVSYRRLYSFREQAQWIEAGYPHYRAYDPFFQITLQSVSRSMVCRIYNPRMQLQKLMKASNRDALETDVVGFLSLLQVEAQVPLYSLGITGSVLIGMHTPNSDMDVVVFGETHCVKVYESLLRLLDDPSCRELKRLDAGGVEKLFAERVGDTKMEFGEFVRLEERKSNQGCFRGRPYFIRFIKGPDEAGDAYGRLRYTQVGRRKIQAIIMDDGDAIFTPCRYGLADVSTAEKESMPDLNEIVSFRGRFCEQARIGDRVLASGMLEKVQDSQGSVRYRLLLGNSSEDTMTVMR